MHNQLLHWAFQFPFIERLGKWKCKLRRLKSRTNRAPQLNGAPKRVPHGTRLPVDFMAVFYASHVWPGIIPYRHSLRLMTPHRDRESGNRGSWDVDANGKCPRRLVHSLSGVGQPVPRTAWWIAGQLNNSGPNRSFSRPIHSSIQPPVDVSYRAGKGRN